MVHSLEKMDAPKTDSKALWAAHLQLAKFNRTRFLPHMLQANWRKRIQEDAVYLGLEGEVLEFERNEILEGTADANFNFTEWFANLLHSGPGQNDPLFDWLAEEANREQMKWFIQQEVAGEAGFEDLTALTQIKMPTNPKLEMARNYWDEMGRGTAHGMHAQMLTRLADELELPPVDIDEIVPESLALANIMVGLAANRRYAYHSIGALGIVEMTAPARSLCVYRGLKRLGLTGDAQRYYLLHSSLDIKHSESWNREVIFPLVRENPALASAIGEGALMRLNAGARCFARYRQELWLN